MSNTLGRDDFLATARNRKRVAVELPELGTLYIQGLSTAQLLEYNQLMLDYEGVRIPPTAFARIVVKLVVFAACNPDGSPMFTDADVDALALYDIKVLMELRKRIIEVSGLGKSVAEVAADLKNDQTSSSSID
jgi:hypothetical protein